LLGSLGGQVTANIGISLENQFKDRQFSFQRPSVEVKDRQIPHFGTQPYSQKNETADMHVLHGNVSTHPTSTTMGPHSDPIQTASHHSAAPTPATHPRPPNPAPYAAPTERASYAAPLWVAINPVPPFLATYPALYAAPTASAPYGSTAWGPCICVNIDDNDVAVCLFDPSFVEPITFCEDSL